MSGNAGATAAVVTGTGAEGGVRMVPLRYLATVTNSNVDKLSSPDEVPVRLCNYVDVYKNDQITNELVFMQATATPAEIARFGLRAGDVIITKDSEDRTDIAVPAYVSETTPDLVCGYHLALLRVRPAIMRGDFLFWALQVKKTQEAFSIEANGVTRFGLTLASIKSARLPAPDLDTQKAIADFLDRETARIDQLIEKKKRLVELLGEKRSALITAAVTGKTVEGGGRVTFPEVPIGAAFDIFSGATPASGQPAYWGGDVPWVGPADLGKLGSRFIELGERSITAEGYASCGTQMVPKGTIILSIRAPIGHMAITSQPMCFNQGCRGLVPRPKWVHTDFAYWSLITRKPQLEAAGQGTTFVELGRDKLRAERIPLPDLDTQKTIADSLDRETTRIDKIIEKTQRSIDLLGEFRSALITAAVTGQIDVTSWNRQGQTGRRLERQGEAMQT